MELTTARLFLRPFRAGDHGELHAIAGDPAVVRWMDWGPNTPEVTAVFLAYALESECEEPRRTWRFAVVRRSDGRLIGSAELHIESPEHRRGTMGYLISPAAQGHGYATEGARAVLEFGLTAGGLHRITATCDPENHSSVRVLEKIGMSREGHLRDHFLIRGEWRDRLLYAKLAQLR
ncbi:GNAT family N-acetyltransferase [Actinoplanes sp. NPDC049599]|uniref:GNAT family N-acetyltransferase n=1 Tax=Actinoplanes sp. NPDC049599 TaxID=3363903 RepID=UPI0037964AB6